MPKPSTTHNAAANADQTPSTANPPTAGPHKGELAPCFALPTAAGGVVSLDEPARRFTVLYFYPRANTSACTQEALNFTEKTTDFAARNALVVGVSKDPVKALVRFQAEHNLAVTLASAAQSDIAESYGVWVQKSMYGKTYMGMERSTFLIDADGKILQVWRKIKVKGHAEAVLKAIDQFA